MAEYFSGTTEIWVPDQLKSGVTRPCRYEPGINGSCQDLATHSGAVVVPARPGKAKDKANATISKLLEDLNGRPLQRVSGSGLSAGRSRRCHSSRRLTPSFCSKLAVARGDGSYARIAAVRPVAARRESYRGESPDRSAYESAMGRSGWAGDVGPRPMFVLKDAGFVIVLASEAHALDSSRLRNGGCHGCHFHPATRERR